MEPKIARRCRSCGASVRGAATYCPQCGNSMEMDNSSAAALPAESREARAQKSRLVDEASRVATTLNEKLPMRPPEAPASGNHKDAAVAAATEREPQADDVPATRTSMSESGAVGSATTMAARTPAPQESRGGVRQRAASVGGAVGENLRPRVERLREASTVMFDEASDDPGLRFVIIAGLLFALFLFFLLLSYLLG